MVALIGIEMSERTVPHLIMLPRVFWELIIYVMPAEVASVSGIG